MRNSIKVAFAAPLALAISACGDKDAADQQVAAGGTETTAPVTTNAPAQMPAVAADARTSVQYAGAYDQRLPDGRTRTITLNADDTYTVRDENGVETTGTYNWYSDNSRILIGTGANKQVYAIADGAIYQLADENTPVTGAMTADQAYFRSAGTAPAM
ncbi:hypothetical protein GRI44_11970 [Altererythrobacter confluentis]|uniref:Uncharacterized protein n=1 Tax=Allopontixanthobacter confluentis TaxID=1849021 RepID=A0A6L7GKR6_9SPHN|nr:copper resistance protein NlpE N-terminal domain-containing protein [Allopontixanthobacter confluentis]MXP15468.1 hypothetical protein [Allopontixanthobacter confluentis]